MPPGSSPAQTLHVDTDITDEFTFGDDNIWPEHVVWEEGHAGLELEGKHEDECMHATADSTPADHELQYPATSNGAQDGAEGIATKEVLIYLAELIVVVMMFNKSRDRNLCTINNNVIS